MHQRKTIRVAWRTRATLSTPDGQRIDVYTRNVSVHGMLAFADVRLEEGAEVSIELRDLRGLVGRVKRSHGDGTVAITFPELTRMQANALRSKIFGAAMRLMEHIGEFPAFSGLTELDQMALSTVCHEVHLTAGEQVLRLGDEATSLFLVKNGCVKLLSPKADGHSEQVDIAYAGQVFGEVSALLGLPHNLDIKAEVDTELLVIPRDALDRLRERNPQLVLTLYEIFTAFMGRRLRRLTARLFAPLSC